MAFKIPKKILRFKGGLGNQLFQLAYLYRLKEMGVEVSADVFSGFSKDKFGRTPSDFILNTNFFTINFTSNKLITNLYLFILKIFNYTKVETSFNLVDENLLIEGYAFLPKTIPGFKYIYSNFFSNILMMNNLCIHVRDFSVEGADEYFTLNDSYYLNKISRYIKEINEIILIGNNPNKLLSLKNKINNNFQIECIAKTNSVSPEEDFKTLLSSNYRIYSSSTFSLSAHFIKKPVKFDFPEMDKNLLDFKKIKDLI